MKLKLQVEYAINKAALVAAFWLCFGLGNTAADSKGTVRFDITQDKGTEFILEAHQAEPNAVLDEIARKTGVAFHYSVLPVATISATCVASSVKAIMECLFAHKVDIAVRYPQTAEKESSQKIPLDLWILGTDFGLAAAQAGNCTVVSASTEPTKTKEYNNKQLDPKQLEKLLSMAKSPEASVRASALAQLATKTNEDDGTIRQVLGAALTDKNAEVRAQAVNSLAKREGDGAVKELQEALLDGDSSVRLMVIDNAGSNTALLQQALSDRDETVRAYAANKLDALLK